MTGTITFGSPQMQTPSITFAIGDRSPSFNPDPFFSEPWSLFEVDWNAAFTAGPGDRVFQVSGIGGSFGPVNLTDPTGNLAIDPPVVIDSTSTITLSTVNLVGQSITFSFQVNSMSLAVQCNNPPAAQLGVPYSHSITATGGTSPYMFAITAGSLPPGLTLNATTGLISGTLTDSALRQNYAFTVTVTDSAGPPHTAGTDCSINVPVGYVPIDNIWESGLARGNELSASMIRLAGFDVWARGAGPLLNTVYGPDKVLSQTPQLLLASGVNATALSANPGLMYALKLDFRQIENFTIQFETNALDAWLELSGFRSYTKSDLYNR